MRISRSNSNSRALMALTAIALTSIFVVAGCGDDEAENPMLPNDPGQAKLRVLHLSPDAPGVDVFLNSASTPVVSNLEFQSGTAYVLVDAGSYRIDIAAHGDAIDQAVLTVPSLALDADRSYTAVAYNSLFQIAPLALVDELEGLASDKIRVRAIHTAVGIGQVDIWNIPSSGAPSILYEDVDFSAVGPYFDLPAGAYTLGFDVNNDATPDVVFSLPALPGGTIANVFAVTDQSGTPFLLAQLQDGSVARIDVN
ncbi:MAG: DUF4397 domain-containing protein [Candidatus Latescibacterota bacterium]|nr:MAG: DUF4397 domain-containing protein [Candidatus Latescibacterota bacterium]